MARMSQVPAEVLLALSDYPEGRTLSDLAAELGRTASSVQRALNSMIRDQVVVRDDGIRPRFRLDERAPVTALKQVARWSLPKERSTRTVRAMKALTARRKALQNLRRAAPGSRAATWVPAAVERVVHRFDPVRIVLFGSQARGESRWDSDFDFLVVLPDTPDRRESAIKVRRALKDLPIAKDVLVISEAESIVPALAGTAVHDARVDGLTVYERG